MVYLWRAVDHQREVIENYVTRSHDEKVALAFMRNALKRHGSPETIAGGVVPINSSSRR